MENENCNVFTIKKPNAYFVIEGEAVSIEDDIIIIRDNKSRQLRIVKFDDVVAANDPL